jgi:hypothetical protein
LWSRSEQKTQKFILRSALRPNQISFSHSLGQKQPRCSSPARLLSPAADILSGEIIIATPPPARACTVGTRGSWTRIFVEISNRSLIHGHTRRAAWRSRACDAKRAGVPWLSQVAADRHLGDIQRLGDALHRLFALDAARGVAQDAPALAMGAQHALAPPGAWEAFPGAWHGIGSWVLPLRYSHPHFASRPAPIARHAGRAQCGAQRGRRYLKG